MGKSRVLAFFLIIVILTIFSIFYPKIQELTGLASNSNSFEEQVYQKEQAILTRVIDGDTIKVILPSESQEKSIRLLGINTPETKMPHASSAKQFLQKFENKKIYLLRDKEDTDKYNRSLRYLFYESRFINLEILEQGFANSYYTEDLKYEEELLKAEAQARELELGIWEKSQEVCASCINLVSINQFEELLVLKNSCNFNCELEGWFVKDAGRNIIYLSPIDSNKQKEFKSSKDIWNNYHDNLFVFDKKGRLVLFYSY